MFHQDDDDNHHFSSLESSATTPTTMLSPSTEFSNVMAQLLMGMEELRRSTEKHRTISSSISTTMMLVTLQMEHVQQFHAELESLLPFLDQLHRWTADRADPQSVEADLWRHVHGKMIHTAYETVQIIMTQFKEPSPWDCSNDDSGNGEAIVMNGDETIGSNAIIRQQQVVDDVLREYQGIVAQMIELILRLVLDSPPPPDDHTTANNNNNNCNKNNPVSSTIPTINDIVQSYVTFQRQTLRTRVKPVIAQLVHERKRGFVAESVSSSSEAQRHQIRIHNDDVDDDDDESLALPQSQSQPALYEKHHANALATILGQAAALIHPLTDWKMSLPPPPPPEEELMLLPQQYHQPPAAAAAAAAAAALVDHVLPLILSRMCTNSIHVLNEQAQQLSKTVSDWFWIDRPVDQYMEQSAMTTTMTECSDDRTAVDDPRGSSNTMMISSFWGTPTTTTIAAGAIGGGVPTKLAPQTLDLGTLDSMVEEMALTCLLLAQYKSLILSNNDQEVQPSMTSDKNNNNNSTTTRMLNNMTIPNELLPEWSWKYAALERYLAVQQWHKALTVAQPVQIVMGTPIYVPSVVEDAQFLSTRALERAASTQVPSAMGTVAHAIAHDVWSTEISGGVHQALIVDERGCWIEPDNSSNNNDAITTSTENSNTQQIPQSNSTFALALLDALDEDLGAPSCTTGSLPTNTKKQGKTTNSNNNNNNNNNSRGNSNPSSGNFLSSAFTTLSGGISSNGGGVNMRLLQMQAKLCALNGIHAASCACRSLVEYLDGLLPSPQPPPQHQESSSEYDNYTTNNHDHETSCNDDNHPQGTTSTTTIIQSAEDAKATAMIQLAREELFRFASIYDATLKQKIHAIVADYAKALPDKKNSCNEQEDDGEGVVITDGPDGLFLDHIGSFIAHESYNIVDAKVLQQLERDDRLEANLMGPLRSYVFLQQLSSRLEFHVLVLMAEHLVARVVQVILITLWRLEKPFTDWGALLLSKQVRLIQGYVEQCVTPPQDDDDGGLVVATRTTSALDTGGGGGGGANRLLFVASSGLVGHWERLTQVMALLQMEQPAEWLMYHDNSSAFTTMNDNDNPHTQNNGTHRQQQLHPLVLQPHEIAKTMSLRVDFKPEAIAAVVHQISSQKEKNRTT